MSFDETPVPMDRDRCAPCPCCDQRKDLAMRFDHKLGVHVITCHADGCVSRCCAFAYKPDDTIADWNRTVPEVKRLEDERAAKKKADAEDFAKTRVQQDKMFNDMALTYKHLGLLR